jgi:predicted AAA+ superfamily ATPase
LAAKAGLSWQRDEALDILAVRWATGRGNRNGRCAYQFARYWVGLKLLEHKA